LLGKNASRQHRVGANATSKPGPGHRAGGRKFDSRKPKVQEESDDEECGRSSMGKKGGASKSAKLQKSTVANTSMASKESKAKKRGSSYLDEVLAQRAAKKSKKTSKAV
jgi:hypothetical protein